MDTKICRYYCLSFNLTKWTFIAYILKIIPESSGAGLHLLESFRGWRPFRCRRVGEEGKCKSTFQISLSLCTRLCPFPEAPCTPDQRFYIFNKLLVDAARHHSECKECREAFFSCYHMVNWCQGQRGWTRFCEYNPKGDSWKQCQGKAGINPLLE